MAYRFKWSGGDEDRPDTRGSVSELTGTVGLFYIFLICLGILFVGLKKFTGPGGVALPGSPVPSHAFSSVAAIRQRALAFFVSLTTLCPGVCSAAAAKIDA